jgi:hypothetical protein
MKHYTIAVEGFESTYALLVRSEDKERNLFESVAYLIFILSAIFSIWIAFDQPFEVPKTTVIHTPSAAHSLETQPRV